MKKTLYIPPTLNNERLDRVISMITGMTRSMAEDLIASFQVQVNNQIISKRSYKVKTDDVVELRIPEGFLDPIEKNPDVKLNVIYTDEHLIVINKEAGQVMHPGMAKERNSIASGLLFKYPEIKAVGQFDRPGIVHRLDKMTSGLVIAARSQLAYEKLTNLIKKRELKRKYVALVEGIVSANNGIIDAPIGRSIYNPRAMDIVVSGKPAISIYRVIRRFNDKNLTFVELELKTGRTHQLRVHLKSIGHPIVGDYLYGAKLPNINRTFLHSYYLSFIHPITNQSMTFKTDLPVDLAKTFYELSGYDSSELIKQISETTC